LRSLMELLQRKTEPYVTEYGDNQIPGAGQLLNSILRTGTEMVPGVGDLLGVEDLQTAAQNNDWGGIGLGALAAIPGIPAIGRGVRGEARAARGAANTVADAVPTNQPMTEAELALARYRAANPNDSGARVLSPGDEGYPTNAQWDEASQAYVAPVEPPAPQRAARPERVPSLRPAMKGTDGRIYTADDNHFTAMATMPENVRRATGLNDSYRGFVDDRGRYLNRARAQEYALNFGLLRDDAPSWARNNHELVSEYLRPYEPPAPIAPVEPDYPIRAYHGSPHSFDRFSLDKIGTGEGAQAYGHGLYFAESEDVARGYRDTLAGDGLLRPDGTIWNPQSLQHMNVRVAANRNGADLDATIARAREVFGRAVESSPPETVAMARADLAELEALRDAGGVVPNPGSMYEVGINADPNTFLDWDKPLSEQPSGVRDAINRVGRDVEPYGLDRIADDMRGIDMSRMLGNRAATNRLAQEGVSGIRYLDGNSRGVGEGSSNYVVFNDELVKILRKYGISGLSTTVGASALAEELDRRERVSPF
jgi:hypothetical protein